MNSRLTSSSKSRIQRRRRWRFLVGGNVLLMLLLAAMLVGMINFVSFRNYHRFHVSGSPQYQLSDKTKNILEAMPAHVRVVIFFDNNNPVLPEVSDLLEEYAFAGKGLIDTQWVDPHRHRAHAEELMKRYQLQGPNVIIFDDGLRYETVAENDIVTFDESGDVPQEPTNLKSFRGEQAFSAAIYRLSEGSLPKVYFLSGHGERSIDNFNQGVGYAEIARALRLDNIEVDELNLAERHAIPEDGDALIIAGPRVPLSHPEVKLIDEYLENSGRLFLLQDSYTQSGLELLLEKWNIRIRNDVVVDESRTLTGRELYVDDFLEHPITRRLYGIMTVLYLPRTVEAAAGGDKGAADKPIAFSLATCSAEGWAEQDLDITPMKYDADSDRVGPIAIAAAAERGPVAGVDVEINPTRVVVVGDSDFAANKVMTGGDRDFFQSALNWLLERETHLAITPKQVDLYQLVMDREQLRKLALVVIGGLPGVVAVLGWLVWLRRRRG